MVTDQLGRPLHDLRLSVTDRCNFRCRYCMPRELFGADHVFRPRTELLSYAELTRLVGVFARLGVSKVRLTGGEPLLRRDLALLVEAIAATPGITDVAMTTNGSLLEAHAGRLRAAGLSRLTVSLDTLDPGAFSAMADTPVRLEQVLKGLAAARAAGFGPIKLNAVLKAGINDDAVLPLVDYAREHNDVIRFIEYMDVGSTNGWQTEHVVPAALVLARIAAVHGVEPIDPAYPGEVAERYRFTDGRGEFGLISSVTRPFCRSCTRARVTAIGELFTCLFATDGRDLRSLLRSGRADADADADLERGLRELWAGRADRYSELRGLDAPSPLAPTSGPGPASPRQLGLTARPRAEMSYLGG